VRSASIFDCAASDWLDNDEDCDSNDASCCSSFPSDARSAATDASAAPDLADSVWASLEADLEAFAAPSSHGNDAPNPMASTHAATSTIEVTRFRAAIRTPRSRRATRMVTLARDGR
jgi:hypothetical protein